VGEAGRVGVLDGVGEVTVEREPEGDDFGPGEEVVALGGVLICFSGAESRVKKAKTKSIHAEVRYEAS